MQIAYFHFPTNWDWNFIDLWLQYNSNQYCFFFFNFQMFSCSGVAYVPLLKGHWNDGGGAAYPGNENNVNLQGSWLRVVCGTWSRLPLFSSFSPSSFFFSSLLTFVYHSNGGCAPCPHVATPLFLQLENDYAFTDINLLIGKCNLSMLSFYFSSFNNMLSTLPLHILYNSINANYQWQQCHFFLWIINEWVFLNQK